MMSQVSSLPCIIQYPWELALQDLKPLDKQSQLTSLLQGYGATILTDKANLALPSVVDRLEKDNKYWYQMPDSSTIYKTRSASVINRIKIEVGNKTKATSQRDELLDDFLASLEMIKKYNEKVLETKKGISQVKVNTSWRDFSKLLLENYDSAEEFIKDPLIKSIARSQNIYNALSVVMDKPNVHLKPTEKKLNLSKVKKINRSQLIKIAQIPGKTIQQKAGAKGLLPAVSKKENFDLIENRVVLHFAKLVLDEYDNSNEEVKADGEVIKLYEYCKILTKNLYFSEVSVLRDYCKKPNQVLLKNRSYKEIWERYGQFKNRHEEKANCNAWLRRVFLDLVRVNLGLSFYQATKNALDIHPFSRSFSLKTIEKNGSWFNPEHLPSPEIIFAQKEQKLVILVSQKDILDLIYSEDPFVSRLLPISNYSVEVKNLNADFYLFLVSTDPALNQKISIWPIYGLVPDPKEDESDVHSIEAALRSLDKALGKTRQNLSTIEGDCQVNQALLFLPYTESEKISRVQGLCDSLGSIDPIFTTLGHGENFDYLTRILEL